MGLWYGVEDGYLRIELDDGSVLLVAAWWEGLSRCGGELRRQLDSRLGSSHATITIEVLAELPLKSL